jgi:hypothetical protein
MADEETNNSWLVRTKRVAVRDKKLTLVMGKYERIGYINYLDIEAAEADGDVNCDGAVDLKDVIGILQVASGGEPELTWCGKTMGDLDGNGRIGLEDGIGVLRQLAP